MWKYVSGIKFGCGFGIDGFVTGDKNRCFGEGVCNCKYGIVGFGKGKFNNEVHGDRSKRGVVSV